MNIRALASLFFLCNPLWSCGRFGFGWDGSPDEASSDGPSLDGDSPEERLCIPLSGSFTLEPPVLDTVLSSDALEGEITLSADGLTIFFASSRHDGRWDSFRATRPSLDHSFGVPTAQTEINTPDEELRFVLSRDGLTAYFNTRWTGYTNASDILVAHRPSTTDPFTREMFAILQGVNTAGEDYDPWVSDDGLRLYFVQGPERPPDGLDLVLAQRQSVDGVFDVAQGIAGLGSTFSDDNPTLTEDELVIVFSSDRSGRGDLFYAVRTDPDQPFSEPEPLPVVNDPHAIDAEAWISSPTCELFFVSWRGEEPGQGDIYRSRFVTD